MSLRRYSRAGSMLRRKLLPNQKSGSIISDTEVLPEASHHPSSGRQGGTNHSVSFVISSRKKGVEGKHSLQISRKLTQALDQPARGVKLKLIRIGDNLYETTKKAFISIQQELFQRLIETVKGGKLEGKKKKRQLISDVFEMGSVLYDFSFPTFSLEIEALFILVEILLLYKDYNSAIIYLQHARSLAEIKHLYSLKLEAYKKLGNAYKALNKYDLALYYYKKQLQLAWMEGQGRAELDAYDNIGMTFYYMGKLDRAINFHNRMMKGYCEKNTSVREWNTNMLQKERDRKLFKDVIDFHSLFYLFKRAKENNQTFIFPDRDPSEIAKFESKVMRVEKKEKLLLPQLHKEFISKKEEIYETATHQVEMSQGPSHQRLNIKTVQKAANKLYKEELRRLNLASKSRYINLRRSSRATIQAKEEARTKSVDDISRQRFSVVSSDNSSSNYNFNEFKSSYSHLSNTRLSHNRFLVYTIALNQLSKHLHEFSQHILAECYQQVRGRVEDKRFFSDFADFIVLLRSNKSPLKAR